jgi:hypothetical protein
MPDSPADPLRRAFPFGSKEQMRHAFGIQKTERDQRTLDAFLEGLENAPGAAAKKQAQIDWNRRKRRKKTPPAQTSPRKETT